MLTHIHIWNFAIVEKLDLELEAGMTVLTGETGAGKSILLDALGLALGDRADSNVIRHGAEKAEISVTFDTREAAAAEAWLQDHELASEEECIIRRTISNKGASRAFINGKPCPITLLRELGEMLVDLHGQHEHHSLLRHEVQQQLLDDYARHPSLLTAVARAYTQWQSLNKDMQELEQARSERASRLELLRYQVSELETLNLAIGEANELDTEHKRLANAREILESSDQILNRLEENDQASVTTLLSQSLSDLQSLTGLDSNLKNAASLLDSASIQINEAVNELRHYRDNIALDPQRLAEIETRLAVITDLSRKHQIAPPELPAHFSRLQAELAQLEQADLRAGRLQQDIEQASSEYLSRARKLSQSRNRAAKKLSTQVSEQMQQLGMDGGRFQIELEARAENNFSQWGQEIPEFVVSANPGQPLKALNKVASGGELSRISLAIQVIGADVSLTPTLIFDEVDVGIGGRVAEIVGRKLRELGHHQQVICVTHLPQVAALGHQHLQVCKQADGGNTSSDIQTLSETQRVDEIARMLGGLKITKQTLSHAREMIEEAQV
ncbi:DNA repair protein RecN [hydrothermal vent metagenome]|uniref:DNA repair protein RecN n=1 Tax=hydrothermal vent metagenome TaxID=652676 RepID=A0A3B1B238_9ZZZZ